MRFFFTGPRIFGIRPGISFNPNELRSRRQPATRRSGGMTGSFLYVIRGAGDHHKIGVSTDPIKRLSELQTGSHELLTFAFLGVTPGLGYDIERAAHSLLAAQRRAGEWFAVPASIATGAILEAANRLGQPIQQVSQEMVPHIIHLANQPAGPPPVPRKISDFWGGVIWVCLCVVGVGIAYAIVH